MTNIFYAIPLLLSLLQIEARIFSKDELLSVVVIFRHGDRTPVEPYPNDPYRNNSFWPVGFGQLTNEGKEQHFKLGKWLRNRYDTFLPEKYSEKNIYVRATDVDRTLMSAEANLAGLFPPRNEQVWDASLPWQPIPVHTIPELDDPVLAMKKPCPKYQHLYRELFKTPYFRNVSHSLHDLYAYLTRYSGNTVSSLETLEYLYNTLFIETKNNFTLPQWARKVYPEKLKPWAEMSFATACFNQELARLKTGPLLDQILSFFEDRSKSNEGVKFKIYSGHDTTIANVLNSLGVFEWHCPPYAATLMFEQYRSKDSNSTYINLFYKNDTEPVLLNVKGCEVDCKLEDLTGLLGPVRVTVDDWEVECHMSIFWPFGFMANLIFLFVTVAGVLIAFSAIMVVRLGNKKRNTSYIQLPNEEVA